MKTDDDRFEIIEERLENMTEMAKQRRGFLETPEGKELGRNGKYIRIRGENFRAVCLRDDAPLCGYVENGAKKIETILKHFDRGSASMAAAKKSKEERRLQSWIIRQALVNGGDIWEALGLSDPDRGKLLFALDEISLGDVKHEPTIRCDILAVEKHGKATIPVLVELKSRRELSRLITGAR
ncbi:MAG: hypothetical protein K8R59_04875 [Thermoanaerobaculales bacterium]|nr:hypothetical protein [Thermoanaerobaculales bacterium]